MTDEDFDYEAHERLRERVANEADSVLWTFKAYYVGADWYSKVDRLLDWFVFGVAGLLTIALIWDSTPQFILIGLAITTAIISGYRRMADPGDKAENYYRAAHAYQRLFDDLRDFIKLELAKKDISLDQMESRYEDLAERRRNLNEDMPEVTSRWYEKLDESIYDEVDTTEKAKERLTGEAQVYPPGPSHCLSDDEVADRLADEAELEDDQ
ncbi:SLATT domain-containing protein [Halomicrobium katesii]|uniref:SLATT domain-containing protein n=1 Tax=Halomicrobium katesii TaxID=437163 RepID=UPI0003740696|nr:SLATT domain-containing protein [Halomicrobium katesii]